MHTVEMFVTKICHNFKTQYDYLYIFLSVRSQSAKLRDFYSSCSIFFGSSALFSTVTWYIFSISPFLSYLGSWQLIQLSGQW